MVDARLFQLCGFLVERNFLPSDDCARIRDEMEAAEYAAAGVVHDGELVLDLDHRRTKRVDVGETTARQVSNRLDAVRPQLERHFRLALQGCQELQFLRYASGDFFRRHADTRDAAGAPDFLRDRKISAVIFLGHTGDTAAVDRGGDLMFHGLLDDPRIGDRGFPFPAAEGTLLAFPSGVSHEVTTVTSGQRFSIATWFY